LKVSRGVVFALCAACFYGGVPNFARLAFGSGVPALETVLMRTSTVAVVLGFVALWRGEICKIPAAAWPSFLLQSLATLMVSACYLACLQFIPVPLAVIIFFAFPVIILVSAPLVEKKTPSMKSLAIALLAFTGLTIAIGTEIQTLDLRGVLLAALAALGCAFQFFSGRALSKYMQPAAFGSLVHLAIWPFVFALMIFTGTGSMKMLNGDLPTVAYIFVSGVCAVYVLGYFFHMSAVTAAPASRVAPFFNLEPIITMSISAIFLGETLSFNQYGGGALVLAALLLASTAGKRNDTA
jgi:drug/metabolite transporter (DMT)-like permease